MKAHCGAHAATHDGGGALDVCAAASEPRIGIAFNVARCPNHVARSSEMLELRQGRARVALPGVRILCTLHLHIDVPNDDDGDDDDGRAATPPR